MPLREQIGERLIGEEPVTLAVQQPVDRVLRQHPAAELRHIIEQVTLALRHS
ncbi:MAG: hypothetical protein ACR2JG_06375 [Geodermatophilaceae bacterium]